MLKLCREARGGGVGPKSVFGSPAAQTNGGGSVLLLALEIGIGIGKIAVRLMIGDPCHFGSVIGNRTPNSDFR